MMIAFYIANMVLGISINCAVYAAQAFCVAWAVRKGWEAGKK